MEVARIEAQDIISKTDTVSLLLIEDDDIDAMYIMRDFKKRKIANPFLRAVDGLDALEKLRNGKVARPFIILLDLQMPRMNGIEFLEELRKDEALSDSVVFVLTTSKDERDIVSSYENHIAGYFVKEAPGEGFLSVIEVLDGYWRLAHLPPQKS